MHPVTSLSLFGQPPRIRFSWVITYKVGVSILLTGALCVVVVGKQQNICCYIVEWLIGYEALSLELLGFCGCSQDPQQISCLVGGIQLGKHSSSIWNLVPLYLMWCIWRERNQHTFKNIDKSDDHLLACFTGSLYDWAKAWELTSNDSLPLFLSSLFLCNQFSFLFFFLLCNLKYALCVFA